MINEKSIYKAEIIEFYYDEKGNLKDKIDNYKNNTMVVIQDLYTIDIDTCEEYEYYKTGMEVIPRKKYIYNLKKPEEVDLVLTARALVAYKKFLKNNIEVDSEKKLVKFRPKENRDK